MRGEVREPQGPRRLPSMRGHYTEQGRVSHLELNYPEESSISMHISMHVLPRCEQMQVICIRACLISKVCTSIVDRCKQCW